MKTRDILLIYPGERVKKPRLPMSVLTLATYLTRHGHSCTIADERIEDVSDEDIRRSAVIGMSTMSGAQLKSAIATSRRVRRVNPRAPIVWGGAHPSSFPEQTARSPLVDYVVRGEGEEVLLQLTECLLSGKGDVALPSLTYRRGDEIVHTRETAAPPDIDTLPLPRYELLDLHDYIDADDGLSYETSRGCSFRCSFCYVESFHQRKWRGKRPERVVEDLRRIRETTGVNKLLIVDDNFFCNKKRSLDICAAMIAEHAPFTWSATARADFLAHCSPEEIDRLKKSGCRILAIGAESGSSRVLREIRKDISPGQVVSAVEKCVSSGIMPQVSFMIGFPFERERDIRETLDLYDRIERIGGGRAEINGLFIYVPYCGTPLYALAQEYGYRPKNSLEEWEGWNFSDANNNPWLRGRSRGRLQCISRIARFKYLRHRFEFYSDTFKREKLSSPLLRVGYAVSVAVLSALARWRWRRRFFSLGYEWMAWQRLAYRIFRVR